jgi:hypothetical protein
MKDLTKTKIKNGIEFVKKNWWRAVLGVAAIATLGALGYCLTENLGEKKEPEELKAKEDRAYDGDEVETVDINLSTGYVDMFTKYQSGSYELMIDDVKLDDLGLFGDELREGIPEAGEDSRVWMLLSICN